MQGSGGEEKKAVQYAYKLLSYRGRSEMELRGRLSMKGFSPRAVERALKHLNEHGYLNDGALASSLWREAEESKLLGEKGAMAYLRGRGISREEAAEALGGYDELQCGRRLARKKMKTIKTHELIVKRLPGIMARKGYSYDTIRKIMRILPKEEDS